MNMQHPVSLRGISANRFIRKEAVSASDKVGIDPATILSIFSVLRTLLMLCPITPQMAQKRLARRGPLVRRAITKNISFIKDKKVRERTRSVIEERCGSMSLEDVEEFLKESDND